MRFLFPALIVAGILFPTTVLFITSLHEIPRLASTTTSESTIIGLTKRDTYPNNLLVVSAISGLHVSRNSGKTWARPRGQLPPGSFYTVVADPKDTGTAYATNGDIYVTKDGGQDWAKLLASPDLLGPAGAMALACDNAGILYAGGLGVLAYHNGDKRNAWKLWGRSWPSGALARLLVSTPSRGLYAATGNRVLNTVSGGGRWTSVASWSGKITAMTLAPDRTTLYVAVQGQGVWQIGAGNPRHLSGDGLSNATEVYALQSDFVGNDLYAATVLGLARMHRPSDPRNTTWDSNLITTHGDPLVALQPFRHSEGMLALTRGGDLYEGLRIHSQSLVWKNTVSGFVRVATPLVAVLSGTEWKPLLLPASLPHAFTAVDRCTKFGLGAYYDDVCGPIERFFVLFGGSNLFGYPTSQAYMTGNGDVVQDFERARLEWRPDQSVRLAPLNDYLIGQRHFAHQTHSLPGQVCYDSYCIDPRFYQFWRSNISPFNHASIFGPPISQAFLEPSSDGTGRLVYVQYFENARLEQGPLGPEMSYVKGIPRL